MFWKCIGKNNFSKSLGYKKQQIWRKVLRNQKFYPKIILYFYKYININFINTGKSSSRSSWLSAYSSGIKWKQKGEFYSAISFPPVVRDDPSSATLQSKMMGALRLLPVKTNNAHKPTSGTSVSQTLTERWQSWTAELEPFWRTPTVCDPCAEQLGGCHSGTAAHLSWLSLITIALATPLKCKFTQ